MIFRPISSLRYRLLFALLLWHHYVAVRSSNMAPLRHPIHRASSLRPCATLLPKGESFKFLREGAPWLPLVKAILGDDCVRFVVHQKAWLASITLKMTSSFNHQPPPPPPPLHTHAHAPSSLFSFGRCSQVLGNTGVMLSLPQSGTQPWHSDGDHVDNKKHALPHCINVFVPLVSITKANGGTEMIPETHFLNSYDLENPSTTIQAKSGACILFDFRLKHRGLGQQHSLRSASL